MNRLQPSLTLASLCTVAMLGLAGCAGFGAASFPDAAVNPGQTSVGSIQGTLRGGHAPLVGAHIYVLEGTTSGYGTQATSLLKAGYVTSNKGVNSSGGTTTFSTTANVSDPNLPNTSGTPWFYETTDATGSFNISGDYNCTAGDPVYIYAYGGSPTYPSFTAGMAIPTNSFTVEAAPGGGVYTILVNTTATQLFYEGEPVAFAGYTTDTFMNGVANGGVLAANLSTTQFETTISETAMTLSVGTTYTASGTVTPTPGFNPGVVNLAVLGVCPSSGSLAAGGLLFNGNTSTAINYVFVNEVSTVAAAYAFAGFTPTSPSSTTNASYVGTSSNNLIGLENAALNAGLLYDINGSQVSTVYDGEGNIANPQTPSLTVGSTIYGGNGSVPQNLIDTLGNILAACVDSNNTTSAQSTQCATLFDTATGNGIPNTFGGYGTIPVDTAQAAINIAHYPAGNPAYTSSPSFVNSLYTLPTGNVPFTPNLVSSGAGQPNDFTVAIQYPFIFSANPKITSTGGFGGNDYANGAESVAIDGDGNVWVDSITNKTVYEITPQGIPAYTATNDNGGIQVGYVTIDPSNNVWTGSHGGLAASTSNTGETEISATTANANTGTLYSGTSGHVEYYYNSNYGMAYPFNIGGFFDGYASVSNWSGYVFIGLSDPQGGYTLSTGDSGQWYTAAISAPTLGTQTNYISQPVAFCSSGSGTGSFYNANCQGAEIGHGAVQNETAGMSHGNIWWTGEIYDYPGYPSPVGPGSNFITLVSGTSGATAGSSFPLFYSATGTNSTILDPTNLAVDANGNAWVAEYNGGTGTTISEVTGAGMLTNYSGNTFTGPFAVALDGAGNAFVTNRGSDNGTSIAEFSATAATPKAISPASTGYTLGGQINAPLNDAMDQSGNLWITSYHNSQVVQWIGAGLPAANPLSTASANGKIGSEP